MKGQREIFESSVYELGTDTELSTTEIHSVSLRYTDELSSGEYLHGEWQRLKTHTKTREHDDLAS